MACCFLVACDNNDSDDLLSDNPVIGRWEILSHSNDTALDCCEFLKFGLDENADDLIGKYIYSGPDFNVEGSYELFKDDENILMNHNNEWELLHLAISGKELILTGQEKIVTYQKID